MRLYLAYRSAGAAKFFVAVDDEAELAKADESMGVRDGGMWHHGRSTMFGNAVRNALGLEGADSRFVLAHYTIGGIFSCTLVGPACDRLGELAEVFPTKLGPLAWFKVHFQESIIVEMLEKRLSDAMLGAAP